MKQSLNIKQSIVIKREEDGSYIVYTESEPLFYYVRYSLEEVMKLVTDTYQSYEKLIQNENNTKHTS
jgi:predicted RNase H-like HicB family nuclease